MDVNNYAFYSEARKCGRERVEPGIRGQVPDTFPLSLGLVICEMMAGVVASQGSQTECWRASTSEGSWCGKWGTLGSTPLQPGQFCFPLLYTLAAMESFI